MNFKQSQLSCLRVTYERLVTKFVTSKFRHLKRSLYAREILEERELVDPIGFSRVPYDNDLELKLTVKKISHSSYLVTRKSDHWWTNYVANLYDRVDDPRKLIFTLGPELAHFVGIQMVKKEGSRLHLLDSDQMLFPTVEHLNLKLDQLDQLLIQRGYQPTAVRFYEDNPADKKKVTTYMDGFVKEHGRLYLPVGKLQRGTADELGTMLHDLIEHIPVAFLFHPKMISHTQHQARFLRTFFKELKENQLYERIQMEIPLDVDSFVTYLDNGMAESSFEYNFTPTIFWSSYLKERRLTANNTVELRTFGARWSQFILSRSPSRLNPPAVGGQYFNRLKEHEKRDEEASLKAISLLKKVAADYKSQYGFDPMTEVFNENVHSLILSRFRQVQEAINGYNPEY